jgi:hypothetical protein
MAIVHSPRATHVLPSVPEMGNERGQLSTHYLSLPPGGKGATTTTAASTGTKTNRAQRIDAVRKRVNANMEGGARHFTEDGTRTLHNIAIQNACNRKNPSVSGVQTVAMLVDRGKRRRRCSMANLCPTQRVSVGKTDNVNNESSSILDGSSDSDSSSSKSAEFLRHRGRSRTMSMTGFMNHPRQDASMTKARVDAAQYIFKKDMSVTFQQLAWFRARQLNHVPDHSCTHNLEGRISERSVVMLVDLTSFKTNARKCITVGARSNDIFRQVCEAVDRFSTSAKEYYEAAEKRAHLLRNQERSLRRKRRKREDRQRKKFKNRKNVYSAKVRKLAKPWTPCQFSMHIFCTQELKNRLVTDNTLDPIKCSTPAFQWTLYEIDGGGGGGGDVNQTSSCDSEEEMPAYPINEERIVTYTTALNQIKLKYASKYRAKSQSNKDGRHDRCYLFSCDEDLASRFHTVYAPRFKPHKLHMVHDPHLTIKMLSDIITHMDTEH